MKFYLFLLCFLSSSSSMAMHEEGDIKKIAAVIPSSPQVPPLLLDKNNSAHPATSPRAISLPHPLTPHSPLSPRPSSWSCSSLPPLSPHSQSSPLSPSSWEMQHYLPRLETILPEYWRNKSEISLLSPWGKLESVEFKGALSLPASSSLSSSSDLGDDRSDFTIKSEEECIEVLSSPFKETIQYLKIDFLPTVDLLHQTLESLSSLNYLYFNFQSGKKISNSHNPSLMFVKHKYLTLSKQDIIDLSPETILQLLQGNEEALQVIRTKSSEGMQAASYILGQIYKNHQIIPEEKKEENEMNVFLCYNQAKDNAGAQYDLARYLTKAGARADTPRTRSWRDGSFQLFISAAEQGHRKAQFRLAKDALVREKDEEKAIRLFESSAKQGYTKAQVYLGWLYAKTNMSQAVLWLQKLAGKGHLHAQYNLAMIYKDPRIQYIGQLPQEERAQEAFRLLTLAAVRNLKEAYLPLGDLYYENQGIPSETSTSARMDEAWKWFLLAAEGREIEAKFKLALMCLCEKKVKVVDAKKEFLDEIKPLFYIWFVHTYSQKVGETPGDNDKKAIKWLKKATQEHKTKHGELCWQRSTMQFALAWMHMHGRVEDGKSKEEHDAIAVDLLKKAASQELKETLREPQREPLREAEFFLGKMYWEGRVPGGQSPENDSRAFDLFNRAAEKGIVEALFYLGEMYYEERVKGGEPLDKKLKATKFYKQARKKGLKIAEDKLNIIYYGLSI